MLGKLKEDSSELRIKLVEEPSIEDRIKILEDKHLLTNDRISEMFDTIRFLERKIINYE